MVTFAILRRAAGSAWQRAISSWVSWPLAIGSRPTMPIATSPSATPWTSSGCRPQKSAICSKVSVVFSTSQTAVAFGISGCAMTNSLDVVQKGREIPLPARLHQLNLGFPLEKTRRLPRKAENDSEQAERHAGDAELDLPRGQLGADPLGPTLQVEIVGQHVLREQGIAQQHAEQHRVQIARQPDQPAQRR